RSPRDWSSDVCSSDLDGDIKLGAHEMGWYFTPRSEWKAGDYVLEAESILEDLAGNRIGRAFEVDETGPQRDDPPTVYRRPFKVRSEERRVGKESGYSR